MWTFVPEQRRCQDAPGAGLIVSDCAREEGSPALQLIITNGQQIHVPLPKVPELVWQILSQAGDPYRLINEVVALSVDRAEDLDQPKG